MQKVYHNIPQIKSALVEANITVHIWGRATGKTEYDALFLKRNMEAMPRSSSALTSDSYTNILTKILPGVIKSWEKYGHIQDKHFWVNRFPPKNIKIPRPIRPVQSSLNSIFWWNGSSTQILSSKTMANGLEADSHIFEEARFLPYDKVREIVLTGRGNFSHFGHTHNHGSILFCSDMPRGESQKWLMDYEKNMDVEVIEAILQTAVLINKLKADLPYSGLQSGRLLKHKINKFEKSLTELRKISVFFSRASTLDNIHALGINTIERFKAILSPQDFAISVLNQEQDGVEGGFYPLLDESLHTYVNENEDYILSREYNKALKKDCMWDSDILKGPLDIAMDANIAISSLIVAQPRPTVNTVNILNAMYVEHPQRISDLIANFNSYYAPHKGKSNVINFYYDHTFVASGDASRRQSYADEVIQLLSAAGWVVSKHYIGQQPSHNDRYELWNKLFKGGVRQLPTVLFNRTNCPDLLSSMKYTKAYQGSKGVQKDKKTEKHWKQTSQVHKPHLGDALDTYITGKYLKAASQRNSSGMAVSMTG